MNPVNSLTNAGLLFAKTLFEQNEFHIRDSVQLCRDNPDFCIAMFSIHSSGRLIFFVWIQPEF